jgi:hypothetical protein
VQVYAVEQRAADFSEIALNDSARASAFSGRIAKIAAGTGVHVTNATSVQSQSADLLSQYFRALSRTKYRN